MTPKPSSIRKIAIRAATGFALSAAAILGARHIWLPHGKHRVADRVLLPETKPTERRPASFLFYSWVEENV